MLSISASVMGIPIPFPLGRKDFNGPGMELYVSIMVPIVIASVTRIASLITNDLSSSPSGSNNSFKTGCKASFAEKSRSCFPCTSRFSSLFHLFGNQNQEKC
ncbi:hypothetical protein HanXRQr2_Chr08g0328021 [Helianthus annuus]|uniref:Uncharacterized protein n=1 Tax=Helianthus annuus TaxID=4232 RepID=A0A9K3ICR2_HELAN|nr:hypothetical protein HanXRQr2_Chr08g0328021 [Helianthus annuus]KAJ0900740.1 hypothetical protein HanPSC8_Chr08g0317191 [Helianthus annuus]